MLKQLVARVQLYWDKRFVLLARLRVCEAARRTYHEKLLAIISR